MARFELGLIHEQKIGMRIGAANNLIHRSIRVDPELEGITNAPAAKGQHSRQLILRQRIDEKLPFKFGFGERELEKT